MVSFGVGLAPVEPLEKIQWVARKVEELGFEYLVHADQRFAGEKDVFVTLTSDATVTKTIKLGPCISDPYSRIPAMLGVAIASLDEISKGRALLTLGAGGSGFSQMHLRREHANVALREAVTIIRSLFSGELTTFEGQLYKVTNAKLNFKSRPNIPIFLATRSPMNLELAGEIADGAVIASYASPEQIKFALDKVRKGAEKGHKKFQDVKLISWAYTSISDNGKDAVTNVRSFVTQALVNTSEEAYPVIFKKSGQAVQDFLIECRKQGEKGLEAAQKDRKFLTDEVIQNFSVAGTPEDCIEKIEQIKKLGINTIWLRCFSAPFSQSEHEKVFIPFAQKVMPHFG